MKQFDLAMAAYAIELQRLLTECGSWLATYEAHVMEVFND